MTLVIETLYAWVGEDETGEGVMAFQDDTGSWFPMLGADMERMESLRPLAEEQAERSGQPIKLLSFDRRTEVEVYVPK